MSDKLVAKIDEGEIWIFSLSATWLLLGGLHLIAWNFHFPTETEKILWRVASLVSAGGPIVCLLSIFTPLPNEKISTAFFFTSVIVGVVSRALLMGLMLASLRTLPPSAYETVAWTAYIPHL